MSLLLEMWFHAMLKKQRDSTLYIHKKTRHHSADYSVRASRQRKMAAVGMWSIQRPRPSVAAFEDRLRRLQTTTNTTHPTQDSLRCRDEANELAMGQEVHDASVMVGTSWLKAC